MKSSCLSIGLLCASCALNGEPLGEITDSAEIQHYELTLTNENGTCKLNYHNSSGPQQRVMSPKSPCYFLRRGEAKPQSFSYPDVGVDAVLIVVGQPLDDDKRKTWNLSEEWICGEEIPGLSRCPQLLVNSGVFTWSRL
jgi:hypothetical protein